MLYANSLLHVQIYRSKNPLSLLRDNYFKFRSKLCFTVASTEFQNILYDI